MKTPMQELFSQLELEHPELFNTKTLEGRKFINDYYKFFEMEKEQIIESYSAGVMAQFDLSIETGEHYYNKNFKINGN
jgi:uncharacterized protein (DUF2164 family)